MYIFVTKPLEKDIDIKFATMNLTSWFELKTRAGKVVVRYIPDDEFLKNFKLNDKLLIKYNKQSNTIKRLLGYGN